MKSNNFKYLLLILSLSYIIFQGCFDVKREIKFYPNGSGEERIYIDLENTVFDTFKKYAAMDPTGNATRKIDSLMNNELWRNNIILDYQKTPNISVKEVSVSDRNDGGKNINIYYLFDDPSALVRTVKEATANISNGQNINYATMKFFDEGEVLRFKYVLRNATRYYDDTTALNLFSGLINTKRVSYTIEMPFEVITSNATSQNGNILNWEFDLRDIMFNQVEMTAEMKREPGLNLPYAEKLEKDIVKVEKNKNPLLRVVVFNGNQEEVKIGTGIVLQDGLMVTNYSLMNVLEGLGYYAIRLNNDSLAGIDDMRKSDLQEKQDLVFLRFSNFEQTKTVKYGTSDQIVKNKKIKIYYYPNTLSSVVYSMDGEITDLKKWKGGDIFEVKPNKPLNIEGGAIYDENYTFLGMITKAYEGTVGRIYAIPASLIKQAVPGRK